MSEAMVGSRSIRDAVEDVYRRDGLREEAYVMAFIVATEKLRAMLSFASVIPLRDEMNALLAEMDAADPGNYKPCYVCGDSTGVRCCEFGRDTA